MARTVEKIAKDFAKSLMYNKNPEEIYKLAQRLDDVPYLRDIDINYDFGYEGEGPGLELLANYLGKYPIGHTQYVDKNSKSKIEERVKTIFSDLSKRTGFKFKKIGAYGSSSYCSAYAVLKNSSKIYVLLIQEISRKKRLKLMSKRMRNDDS